MKGVIEVSMWDGLSTYPLDLMGRGSVLGSYFLIGKAVWQYQAKAKTVQSCIILRVPYHLIHEVSMYDQALSKDIAKFEE